MQALCPFWDLTPGKSSDDATSRLGQSAPILQALARLAFLAWDKGFLQTWHKVFLVGIFAHAKPIEACDCQSAADGKM